MSRYGRDGGGGGGGGRGRGRGRPLAAQGQPGERKPFREQLKTLPRVWLLIRPYLPLLGFCLFLTLIRSTVDLLQPFLMKVVVDTLTPFASGAARLAQAAHATTGSAAWTGPSLLARLHLTPLEFLFGVGGCGLVALVVSAGCSFLTGRLIGRVTNRLICDYRNRLQYHLTRTTIQRMDDLKIGGMIARIMTDPENLTVLAGQDLVSAIGAVFTLLVATTVLFWLNVPMAALAALSLPLLVIAARSLIVKLRPLAREFREENQRVTADLTESLGGARVVKAYHRENWESEKFVGASEGLFTRSVRILDIEINLGALMGVLTGLVSLAILVFGGVEIVQGAMTVGDLMQFYGTLLMMLFPVGQMFRFAGSLQTGLAGLDRIEEVLQMEPEARDDAAKAPWPEHPGAIVFDRVGFRYGAEQPLVLENISFRAAPGTVTALVGPSGSGKSTLVHLIARFLTPAEGAIRMTDGAAVAAAVDASTGADAGREIGAIRLEDWRRHLGMVLQENYLFDGTIRENIAYARPEAAEAEVTQAAELANCGDFIRDFKDGLDTVVGERGVRLSGGQKQRISIARALLAQPALLIFDEATSSLDSESEAAIQAGMQRLIRNRTTFVIAHRLSTIRNADRILVLEKGRLIEQGDHATLMAAQGRYYAMYTAQYGVEADRLRLPGDRLDQPEPPPAPAEETPTGQRSGGLSEIPFLRPPTG
ncbi:MAG: ABC transporter ATP-binding protein [Planctomycetota bacterium]